MLNDVDVSPWQYRFDMWHRLNELTHRIVDESRSSGDISLMHRDVVGVYRKIEIVENYWGKPGRDIVKRLGDCVDRGNYRDLNQISSHVLRLLSDGTHRVPGELLDGE